MSIPDETPLFIPDPIDEPILGTSRARAKRSRNGEMKVVWGLLGVAGVCCLGYAFYLALADTSPGPAAPPAKTAVVVPASPAEDEGDDDRFGDDYVRREAIRHRLKDRRNRAEVPLREPAETTQQQEPAAEVVVEPEPAPIPPDTRRSFDDGSAFDRPAVDSSRQLRRRRNNGEFGTYQAPAPRGLAPNSDRPNRPDPSFDETPVDRPMLKKGARR